MPGISLRELGVRREQRVLLVLDDTTVFPIVFLGAIRIGAVPVPGESARQGRQLPPLRRGLIRRARRHRRSGARAACGSARRSPRAVPGSRTRGLGVVEFDQAVGAQPEELDPAATHRDDVAFWLYSSGSTGKPKGVVHLQHDIGVTCETYARQVLGAAGGRCDVLDDEAVSRLRARQRPLVPASRAARRLC